MGAILGGVIGLVIYGWLKKWHSPQLLAWLDISIYGLPLAQAVGRLGNWFNYELYGRPTGLPWGIYVPESSRLVGFEDYAYYHPLFAYEASLESF